MGLLQIRKRQTEIAQTQTEPETVLELLTQMDLDRAKRIRRIILQIIQDMQTTQDKTTLMLIITFTGFLKARIEKISDKELLEKYEECKRQVSALVNFVETPG